MEIMTNFNTTETQFIWIFLQQSNEDQIKGGEIYG
jgi:hypothetical protein